MRVALLVFSFLFSAACASTPPRETEIARSVLAAVEKYDGPQPVVVIRDRVRENWLAETHCSGGGQCTIRMRTCVARSDQALELAAHEAAHIVAIERHRYFGHGPIWQDIMTEMGYAPTERPQSPSQCLPGLRLPVSEWL